MGINDILAVLVEFMSIFNVPTALGQNFLDFAEFSLMILFFPIQLIMGLFGG